MPRRAVAVGALIAGLAGVLAAPAGVAVADESAQQTISRLESQGYKVRIDKVGSGPMDQCKVTSVRNPQSVTQLVPYVGPGNGGDRVLVPQVVSQTISVSLDCSR